MEVLSDSYYFLSDLVMSLESGTSSRNFTQNYLRDQDNSWTENLSKFYFRHTNGQEIDSEIHKLQIPYERAIINLLLRSFAGDPVVPELKTIEDQYYLAHKKVLDNQLIKLPYLSMIPLFIFLFPAYLVLLLGPILLSLLKGLS